MKLFGCPIESLQVAFDSQCAAFEHLSVDKLTQIYVAWSHTAQRSHKGSTNHTFAVSMLTWLNNKIISTL